MCDILISNVHTGKQQLKSRPLNWRMSNIDSNFLPPYVLSHPVSPCLALQGVACHVLLSLVLFCLVWSDLVLSKFCLVSLASSYSSLTQTPFHLICIRVCVCVCVCVYDARADQKLFSQEHAQSKVQRTVLGEFSFFCVGFVFMHPSTNECILPCSSCSVLIRTWSILSSGKSEKSQNVLDRASEGTRPWRLHREVRSWTRRDQSQDQYEKEISQEKYRRKRN